MDASRDTGQPVAVLGQFDRLEAPVLGDAEGAGAEQNYDVEIFSTPSPRASSANPYSAMH